MQMTVEQLREKAIEAAKRTAKEQDKPCTAFYPQGNKFGAVCWDGNALHETNWHDTRKSALASIMEVVDI